MTRKAILLSLFILAGLFFSFAISPTKAKNTREHIEQPVNQAIHTRQATQKETEKWRQEKEKLAARFEQLQQEQKHLQQQHEQLEQQIAATQKSLSAQKRQLADTQQISGQIQPFLIDLTEQLKNAIDSDLPFLMAERRARIENLKSLMVDSKINVSEKYRKLMEALLVEAEYGFTIETYQERIKVEGQTLLADVFRFGRINLYYQSLDRKQVGFYNVVEDKWKALPFSHNSAIQTAIDIAAKRQPVELLSLPLGKLVIQ